MIIKRKFALFVACAHVKKEDNVAIYFLELVKTLVPFEAVRKLPALF